MRKIYIIPEMEVVECAKTEVITTSNQNQNGLQVETNGSGSSDSFGNLFG